MERIHQADPTDYAASRRLLLAIVLSLLGHGIIVWFASAGGSASNNLRVGIFAPQRSVLSASLQTDAAVLEAGLTAGPKTVYQRRAVISVDSPDPRFYPVEQLDILPVPHQPIHAGQDAPASGTVRLLARIDASGRVTDVSVFDSDATDTQTMAAAHALRSTTFSSARKDGRAVRSEVIVEMAGASRQ